MFGELVLQTFNLSLLLLLLLLLLMIQVLQYSPKIMHVQEVAQEVLAPQEHASGEKRVKLRFIRKKFQTQEDQNPFRKKPQEVTSPTANRK